MTDFQCVVDKQHELILSGRKVEKIGLKKLRQLTAKFAHKAWNKLVQQHQQLLTVCWNNSGLLDTWIESKEEEQDVCN